RVLELGEPEAPMAKPFPDVAVDAWYAGYINDLKDLSLVNGNPDGTYQPAEFINRAEFLTLAMNVYYYISDQAVRDEIDALEAGVMTDRYEDLADAWYTPTVTVATELGFVGGVVCEGGWCIDAGREISRAEAVIILYNMFYDYLTVR
ncbi:MAG: S-layer homology domain-containing protein, partial [Candidatus Peregrinibacteria bacterium]